MKKTLVIFLLIFMLYGCDNHEVINNDLGYSCPIGYILHDTKCNIEIHQIASEKLYCPDGYIFVTNEQCMNIDNINDIKEALTEKYCPNNLELYGDYCDGTISIDATKLIEKK